MQLGLLPGAGGCVRLPRLIGLFAGVQLLLAGKTLDAPRAHKAGVITGVLASQSLTWPLPETEHPTAAHAAPQPAGFASHLQALKAANKLRRLGPAKKYPRHLTGNTWVEKQLSYKMALKAIDKLTERKYPAPYVLLDTAFRCWDADYETAFDIETKGYTSLVLTHEAKALMSLFTAKSALRSRRACGDASWT